MSVIVCSYILIVRHMKINSFFTNDRWGKAQRRRQQRELRLYFRIIMVIAVLFIMGVPYCVFFAISIINALSPPPPYAARICYVFVAVGYSISVLLSLICTDDVRKVVISFICGQRYNTRPPRKIQCITVVAVGAARTNLETTT